MKPNFSTILKDDVKDRLTTFAQQFSTGMDKWDYSVAIQILLDFWEYSHNQTSVNELSAKLDYMVNFIEQQKQQEEKQDEKIELGMR